MEKFCVEFAGGPASDGVSGCNYLLCKCLNRDGEEVVLYAEYLEPKIDNDEIGRFLFDDCSLDDLREIDPDDLDLTRWLDEDKFDRVSYPELKDEILEQAEENNVDTETLDFSPWDASYSD